MLNQHLDYFGRRASPQRQASPFFPGLAHILDAAQYGKDLRESVEPMLDHIKTVGDSVQIATSVLSTLPSSWPTCSRH
jgi:argininosuccinate lyase